MISLKYFKKYLTILYENKFDCCSNHATALQGVIITQVKTPFLVSSISSDTNLISQIASDALPIKDLDIEFDQSCRNQLRGYYLKIVLNVNTFDRCNIGISCIQKSVFFYENSSEMNWQLKCDHAQMQLQLCRAISLETCHHSVDT